MDGVDVALIETDGENVFSLGPACTVPYTPKLEQLIRDALGDRADNPELVRDITDAHAVAVSTILSQHPEFKNKITIVGLHGHTVAHCLMKGLQSKSATARASPKRLASTWCTTSGRRMWRPAARGSLAPLYHEALSRELDGPLSIVNIGGISNVTWVDPAGTCRRWHSIPGRAMPCSMTG